MVASADDHGVRPATAAADRQRGAGVVHPGAGRRREEGFLDTVWYIQVILHFRSTDFVWVFVPWIM